MFHILKWHVYHFILKIVPLVLLLSIPLTACSLGSLGTRLRPSTQPVAVAGTAPSLAANPSLGYGGKYVQVTGDGWPRNMMVLVALSDSQGESATLAASDTDGNGNLATGFLYPIESRWLKLGPYMILAETADGTITASTEFTVIEAGTDITLTPIATAALTTTPSEVVPITVTTSATPSQVPTSIATSISTPISTPGPAIVAAESAQGGQNNRPPTVEAALTILEGNQEKQRFVIVATASDPDGNLRESMAVIQTPPLSSDLNLELKVQRKIEIKFHSDKAEISAPNPQAILDQLRQFGGLVVQDGQLIDVDISDSPDFKITLEDVLHVEAQSIVLHVVAIDMEGQSAEAVASPVFASDAYADGIDIRSGAFNKDECKKGGWQKLTRADGRRFKNQGDCRPNPSRRSAAS